MPSAATLDAIAPRQTVRRFHSVDLVGDKPRYRRAAHAPIGTHAPIDARKSMRHPSEPLDPNLTRVPLAWLELVPDWLEIAEGVKLVTEGASWVDGGELGRAAGYVYLWDSCFQDGHGGCRRPVPSMTDHEIFYSGGTTASTVNDDGVVVSVLVGSIPIINGHSDRSGARDAFAARKAISRPELQGLVGVLVEDDHGCLFLGAAKPDMTLAEAQMVARSDTSNEFWPITVVDENGNPVVTGLDSIGPVLVTRGAFQKRVPTRHRMLAALGDEWDDELSDDELLNQAIRRSAPTIDIEQARGFYMIGPNPNSAPMLAAAGGAADPVGENTPIGTDPGVVVPDPVAPPPPPPAQEPKQEPKVEAVPQDIDARLLALESRLSAQDEANQRRDETLARIDSAVLRIKASLIRTDDLTLPDEVAELTAKLEEVVDELATLKASQASDRGFFGSDGSGHMLETDTLDELV